METEGDARRAPNDTTENSRSLISYDHPISCMICHRTLGQSFYYTCHTCGAAYCYIHMPEKCDHNQKSRLATPITVGAKRGRENSQNPGARLDVSWRNPKLPKSKTD
jgi:hypothetical protein